MGAAAGWGGGPRPSLADGRRRACRRPARFHATAGGVHDAAPRPRQARREVGLGELAPLWGQGTPGSSRPQPRQCHSALWWWLLFPALGQAPVLRFAPGRTKAAGCRAWHGGWGGSVGRGTKMQAERPTSRSVTGMTSRSRSGSRGSRRALATNGQGNGPHQALVTPSPDLPATAKCPAARKNSPAERQDTNGGSERQGGGGRGSVTCWLRDRGQLLQRARFSVCDTGGGNAASGGRRPRRRGAACARQLRSGPAGGGWSRRSSRPVLESSRKLMRRRAAAPESESRMGAAQPRPPCRPDAGEPDADGRARSLFFLSQFPVASGAASQNRQTPMACSHTPSQTIFESEDSCFRQRDMLALARSVSRTRERRRRAH